MAATGHVPGLLFVAGVAGAVEREVAQGREIRRRVAISTLLAAVEAPTH